MYFPPFLDLEPSNLFIGSTGETIAWTKWGESMDEEHGAPYYHIHVECSQEVVTRYCWSDGDVNPESRLSSFGL